ncbi:MAG: helix-turn-helix domain-containing protein [Kiritimatiellia bacterium]
MTDVVSISEQLKQRRLDLGLSLSEVARRAGTSAATLSRYENGWSRFETYTLRKLALALHCELEITFSPKKTYNARIPTPQDTVDQLARLFWDHPLMIDDLETYPIWVVERVLEFGSLSDIALLRARMGPQAFLKAVAAAQRLSPKTANFWQHILKMEGIPCTKKYSRNTAWNS